jgi:predicted TPR repeat methyltransferase
MHDPTASTASSYDLIADSFAERNAIVPQAFADFLHAFARRIPIGGTVLDLGCGPGRDGVTLQQLGHHTIGIDVSTAMAQKAQASGLPVARGDLRNPPIVGNRCDGIWSVASLLHVPVEQTVSTLSTWRSLLVNGGWLGLSTSLSSTDRAEAGWEIVPYDVEAQPTTSKPQRWFVHHERSTLITQIEAAGFEVVEISERVSHRRWLETIARAV